MNLYQMPIVESSALQVFALNRKSQRLDQVKLDAADSTEPRNIPRVARNFRLNQNNMQKSISQSIAEQLLCWPMS